MKAAVLALALLGFTVGAASAAPGPEICIIVAPIFQLGCKPGPPPPPPPTTTTTTTTTATTTGAPPPPRRQAEGVPEDTEPVRRSSTVPRYDPRRIAVGFQPDASKDDIGKAIADAGGTLERAVPKINAYLVGVDPNRMAQALASLRASPSVAKASQELLSEAFDTSPDDNDWPQQDSLRVVGMPKAWDVTRGSSRIVVAVIDTGVDPDQADLAGALLPGYDFVHGDANPSDDHGHGTAVAGVIAARANNRLGGAGVCSRCSVMPVKVLDAHGNGDDTIIAAGIVWATDHGAKVINLSLGGPGTSQELTNALTYATGKGVIVVAAAGNAGSTTEFYPAADQRTVSVAATTVSDRRYSWSNFGSWVRVAAPGCNVAPILAGGYGYFCGTSSAAPVVTGLVALELSAFPTATPQQVEQALSTAAVPLPQIVQRGRVDAARTLALLRPTGPASAEVSFHGTLRGSVRGRVFRLPSGPGQVSASLRFTRGTRLTLELLAQPGAKPVARVAGESPLEIAATVSGPVVVRITRPTGRKTSYVLRVSYALPASGS